MIRAFRYAGSKQHIVKWLNTFMSYVSDINSYNYVEPFIGSGAVLYNLTHKFNSYIINDYNQYVVQLHQAILTYSYNDYQQTLEYVNQTYGDIKTNKQAFYDFRSLYNTTKHPLYLLMLTNSCINSMMRFGPNGFNSAFGNCHYILSKETWNHIQTLLQQTTIYNESYDIVLSDFLLQYKSVLFLDPPYDGTVVPYCYDNKFSREAFIQKLIHITQQYSHKHIIFYTDIDNCTSDLLLQYGFQKFTTKQLKSIAPSKHSEITHNEVLFIYM